MFHLIAIGDPIIDTHVQIPNNSDQCGITETDKKHLCFDYGSKIPIVDSFQALGGNAPNVAVAATKLSLQTALMSTVGDDTNGAIVLDYLKRFKVDSTLVTNEHGAATRYSIILNYCDDRTILSYSEKKKYIWPEPIPATDWIYYTGLSEGYETIHERLLSHLSTHPSIRLAVNPGSYMLAYALPALREILSLTDVLIVNLEEAEAIAGSKRKTEKSESALIHELIMLGAKEVIITDGIRGAWAGKKDEVWHLDSFPVKIVSKTGAGDAFSAGYITARLHGHDIPHALAWGTANSTGVVGAHGPQAGLLDERGIEKMLEKFSEIQPTQLV